MLIPLAVLAVGALIAGFWYQGSFIGEEYGGFWKSSIFTAESNKILHEIHEAPLIVKFSPFVMMVLGFALALWMYVLDTSVPGKLAAMFPRLYRFLLNKWYFDELYDLVLIRPAKCIGRFFWKGIDGAVIDGLGPDGISARTMDLGRVASKLQTGYIYHYAFVMLIGVAALLSWYVGGHIIGIIGVIFGGGH
jgi:NADH-quinone oxidoreductase subunit L